MSTLNNIFLGLLFLWVAIALILGLNDFALKGLGCLMLSYFGGILMQYVEDGKHE